METITVVHIIAAVLPVYLPSHVNYCHSLSMIKHFPNNSQCIFI